MHGTATIDPTWLNSGPSDKELEFAYMWVELFPHLDLHTEDMIIPKRKFRFDFTHRPSRTAIEIQGYGPGHYSIAGVQRDQEKIRLAAVHGWLVLQVSSDCCSDRTVLQQLADCINGRMAIAS